MGHGSEYTSHFGRSGWRLREVYDTVLDADHRLGTRSLGTSPEIRAVAYRPKPGVRPEILPASPSLRGWLVNRRLAGGDEDTRFAIVRFDDTERFDPLERKELLSKLASLKFRDDGETIEYFRAYGFPVWETGQPSFFAEKLGDDCKIGRSAGTVDFVSPRDYHESESWDSFLSPLWLLEREVTKLRTVLELTYVVVKEDWRKAQLILGPVQSLDRLPFPARNFSDEFGDYFFCQEEPCWALSSRSDWQSVTRPRSGVGDCPMRQHCRAPDDRQGWVLASVLKTFGPCGNRRPLTREEYLTAAHLTVTSLVAQSRYLGTAGPHTSPLLDTGLEPAVKRVFDANMNRDFFSHVFGRPPQPGGYLERYWSGPRCLFEEGRRRAVAEPASRRPLFEFHHVVDGSLGAAWHQMFDLLVHYSELKRCKQCHNLFAATHGNQDYCPSSLPGQRSLCQQAAKKARVRGAKKARTARKPATRRTSPHSR